MPCGRLQHGLLDNRLAIAPSLARQGTTVDPVSGCETAESSRTATEPDWLAIRSRPPYRPRTLSS
jgi:hypothetical protein